MKQKGERMESELTEREEWGSRTSSHKKYRRLARWGRL